MLMPTETSRNVNLYNASMMRFSTFVHDLMTLQAPEGQTRTGEFTFFTEALWYRGCGPRGSDHSRQRGVSHGCDWPPFRRHDSHMSSAWCCSRVAGEIIQQPMGLPTLGASATQGFQIDTVPFKTCGSCAFHATGNFDSSHSVVEFCIPVEVSMDNFSLSQQQWVRSSEFAVDRAE